MKKIVLFISVLLSTATVYPNCLTDELHGGFQPKLRGWYNHRLEQFKADVVDAVNNGHTQDLFPDPKFLDRLVLNAQIETKNNAVDLQYIISKSYLAPLPAGFRNDPNATHEMTVWSADSKSIAFWQARDPEDGEMGLWLDGECIMSLHCANLIRKVPPVPTVEEDRNKYTPPADKPKLQYAGGNTTVNVIVNGGNSNATGGSVTQTGADDEVTFRKRGSSDGDNSVQSTEFIYKEPGIAVKNWGIGIGKGLRGVADLYRAANNDRRDINIRTRSSQRNRNVVRSYPQQQQQQVHRCRLGHANCANPHQQQVHRCRLGHANCANPHWGNGGNGGNGNGSSTAVHYNGTPPGPRQ